MIEFTDQIDGGRVVINPSNVSMLRPSSAGGTLIWFAGMKTAVRVDEDFDEVVKKLCVPGIMVAELQPAR